MNGKFGQQSVTFYQRPSARITPAVIMAIVLIPTEVLNANATLGSPSTRIPSFAGTLTSARKKTAAVIISARIPRAVMCAHAELALRFRATNEAASISMSASKARTNAIITGIAKTRKAIMSVPASGDTSFLKIKEPVKT